MSNIILKNITITNNNTTILYNSYNYKKDIPYLLKYNTCLIELDKKTNINTIPQNILKLFNCEYLLNKEDYTKIDEIKINILNNININKDIYVFFNVLTYTDYEFKFKVISYLKEQNKTIINYTTDIEEVLFLNYLIFIYQEQNIIEGLTQQVLLEEKIFKKLGFNLPFIVELSIGLKYYNLIDEIYFTNESLVDKLWK